MSKINWPLIIGTMIVILLLFTIIYEDSLIRSDPYSLDKGVEYIIGEKVLKLEHPVRPNSVDKLGTDPLGRNVLSIMIKGTKITLGIAFFATILRHLIRIFISFVVKERERKSNRIIIKIISIILNIFIGYIILSRPYFRNLELINAFIAFTLVLGILGWERIEGIDGKFNIKDDYEHLIISFFREMTISLLILAVFGFLGLTIGVNKYSTINTDWGIIPYYTPEWGGMLAIAKQAIERKAYWLVVGPLLFFTLGIMGFLLVVRGLKNNIRYYGTIVSSGMRKIGNFLSPKQYIKDIKRFSWNRSRVVAKSLLIIILILWIAPPITSGERYHGIKEDRVLQDIDRIYEIQKQHGTKSEIAKEKIAEYIEEELSKIHRMFPVFDEKYIQHITQNSKGDTAGELVEGKNIAGYIWGRSSNNPLILVTNYGGDLQENGVSTAILLELARSLGEKNYQSMASRTIVFLFVDGSLEDGLGVYNAIGSKNIDINCFYIYLNYLGLKGSSKLYMDTSSVNSGYKRHYRNIKNIKKVAKEVKMSIRQDYFDDMFVDVETFMENRVSGLAISGIGKKEYHQYMELRGEEKNHITGIDPEKVVEQGKFIMAIAENYAWTDKYWLGDSY